MTNIRIIYFLLIALAPLCLLAQNEASNCTDGISLSSGVTNFKVFSYPPNTRVGMVYNDVSQVKNQMPEELMGSILCANTQGWVNFNEIEPSKLSKVKESQINKANRLKNYFDLLQKIEFNANGTTYVLIKFQLTAESSPKPLNLTETMAFKNNRWMRVTESSLTSLIFMTGMTQMNYLNYLFDGKVTGNTTFDKFLEESKKDNQVDMNKYIKATETFAIKEGIAKMQFMLESDTKATTENITFSKDFVSFKAILKNVSYSYPLRNLEYCEYFEDDSNIKNDTTEFGKIILSKEKIKDRTDSSLIYVHKIKFDYGFSSLVLVKYKIREHNGNFKTKIIWIKAKREIESIKNLENIENTFKYLKPKIFWAFYNSDKTKYPEVDNIKAQFKDSEGILDVDKLGAYLKTKPAALAKYCDFE